MCSNCDWLAQHPENYARQGHTFCLDFVMPSVSEPPSQPATPPPPGDH
jgi:hypothetical protein